MGAKNSFLENNVSVIYRKSILDVMIYTFIAAQRFTVSSITIEESANSFLVFHQISKNELSIDKIVKTFSRMQKEIFDEQKTVNQKRPG